MVFVKKVVVFAVHPFCGKTQANFAWSCNVTEHCRTAFWVSQSPTTVNVSVSIASRKWRQQNQTYWLEKWKATKAENWTMTPVIFAEGISLRQNCMLELCHFFNGLAKTKTNRSKQHSHLSLWFIYVFFRQSIFHAELIVKLLASYIERSGWFLCFPLHILRHWPKETFFIAASE